MDSIVERLEGFGLKEFISQNQRELCERTLNPNKVASALQFDFDMGALINQPPDNFSKCAKLYELIQKKSKVKDFLEALKETGNEHIIEFIESVNLSISIQGESAPTSTNPKMGIWFNIPEPIDSFCGRQDFLNQLHKKLQNQQPVDSAAAVAGPSRPKVTSTITTTTSVTVLSQVKIVSGLGGIGKTETVTQYIMSHLTSYNNFIWIDAESENSMRNSFFKLADEIKVPMKNPEGKSRETQEIAKEIYNKISEGGKSNLIVFDNAEDYQSCRPFFPLGLHPDLKKPVILATSRNQEWISSTGKFQVLPLDKMTDDESLEFIVKQLEIPESEIPGFKEESKEFIELIGGLPLDLQQAVAYIKEERELKVFVGQSYKISDYVKEFKSSMKKFQTFPPNPESSVTVYVTWNLTILKFFDLANGEEAIQILTHLSFLYADKIPFPFLHLLLREIQDAKFSGALKLLNKYSLIKMNVNNYCLSIHRQLQFVILQYLKESKDVKKVTMNLVDNCKVVLENIKLSKSSDIFLNLHQIVNNSLDLIPVTEQFLDFMADFGLVLWEASRYSESLELYKKVYSKRCDLLGENHENTLSSEHQIALQLLYLGRYDEALSLYKEILKKRELCPNFGVDHPNTIATKHNMAGVLRQQGKYQEALEMFQQVLAQENKILGENHPWTLTTQNAIALVHSELGNFSQALDLYEDVEKKQTEVLGPDHRDLFAPKHNRATVLLETGKFQEASKILHEVYEKEKEILGENHSDTIATLEWIAGILQREGKFTQALQLFNKVYENRQTIFGENHPVTIDVKNQIETVGRKLQERNPPL